MDTSPTILIVDDEPLPRLLMRQALRAGDFTVVEAVDGEEALAVAAQRRPALVLMDVGMPGRSGIETVGQMRRVGLMMPVLMLTCYGDVEHRVQGLTAGADDYLTKPFDPRELVARVRALLRRATTPVTPAAAPVTESRWLHLGRTVIDLAAKRAELNGQPLALTKTEFAILDCLFAAQGRPVAREQLLRAVWGYDADTNTRTVETHVWRLRKKIGDTGELPGTIQTRSGIGYCLSPEALAPATSVG